MVGVDFYTTAIMGYYCKFYMLFSALNIHTIVEGMIIQYNLHKRSSIYQTLLKFHMNNLNTENQHLNTQYPNEAP